MKKINTSQQSNPLSDFKRKFPHLSITQIKLGAMHIFAVNKKNALTAVQSDGLQLEFFGAFQNNQEVVSAAVTKNGFALQFADEQLKQNTNIVLAAVEQNGYALEFANEQLKQNTNIALAAVKQNGYALQFTDQQLKQDTDIVLAAVKQNGYALQFADEQLKQNPDIVLAAVKQNGYALQFAGEQLKQNPDIVLAAVEQNGFVLQRVDEQLKQNPDIVLAAVKQNFFVLEFCGKLRDDLEIVTAAITRDPYALKYASPNLQKNKNLITAAISKSPKTIDYAIITKEALNDAAFRQVIFNAHKKLKKDENFQQMRSLGIPSRYYNQQEQCEPLLKANEKLNRSLSVITNLEYNNQINILIEYIDFLSVFHKDLRLNLTKILDQTRDLIEGRISPAEYKKNALNIAEQKSRPLQILGGLMLAVAVIAAGLAIAAACTGIGMVPAIALGSMSVGFFAASIIARKKADTTDYDLVEHISSTATP